MNPSIFKFYTSIFAHCIQILILVNYSASLFEVDKPVKAKVPPSTAQSRVMKCRKLRRSSLMVTVIGDKSYKK